MKTENHICIFLLKVHLILLCPFQCNSSYNIKLSAKVAREYFPHCSMITISSTERPDKISEISDLSIEQFAISKGLSSPHYLFDLGLEKPFPGEKDLRKHLPYCRIVVTFIPCKSAEGKNQSLFNSTRFLELVDARENPLSLRDVDHYIFLLEECSTSADKLAKSILVSEISLELRYKILLVSSPLPEAVNIAFIFCLYCPHTLGNVRGPDSVIKLLFEDSWIDKSTLFPEFAKNLNGHQLKVVGPTKYVSLYEMEKVPGTDRYEHKRGMFTEFFFTMQGKLNFTYHLKPCSGFGNVIPEGNTGVQFPNKTWAGCVADIYYRWADLSMGGSPSSDRLRYVDFSTNMRYDYVQFFTHKPRVIYPWYVVFVCFDIYGWSGVILSLLLGAILLFKTESFMEIPGPKIANVFFYLYAYLLGQDLCVEPRSTSSKVAYVNWLFYGIVIGAAYACSLQSLIVSPGISMVPSTMPELAGAAPDWQCGVPLSFRNGLAETIFRESNNPDMQKLYKATQEDTDAVACLARAASEDYGCFHWLIMAEFYMGTEFMDKAGNHPFLYAKDYILFSGPSWMVRKREIWKWAFNDFFGRQFSMGIVYEASARDRRVVRRQMVQQVRDGKRKPMKSYTIDDDGPKPFAFENVKACFVVLVLGLIISAGSFSQEVLPKFIRRENILKKRCG